MRSSFVFFIIAIGIIASLNACKKSEATSPIVIERLEKSLFEAKSPEDLKKIFTAKPYLAQYFGANVQDTAFINQLYTNCNNPELQKFNAELQTEFGDISNLKSQFEEAFKEIKNNYPDFKAPRIETIVTGFMGNDIYVSDSVIVIGLDYFGGPKAKYRPQLYEYQLRRYQKEYIVPSILFFMADKFNKSDPADKTFLAEMVGYGKSFEFVKHALPNVADSLVIGYSQTQLDDVYASQKDVWAYFLDRKLLYQTREAEKQPFFSERPATVEISQECPGGIGRWVGWRIVSLYLKENKSVSLPDLMNNTNAKQIFEQSNYRGEPDEE